MELNDDEKQFESVIKTLKELQQVKAPPNFEADLMRRINSEDFAEKEKTGFWQRFLIPSRAIPSFGLAVAAVLILFVVNINDIDDSENPFAVEPRIREDVVASETVPQLILKDKQSETRAESPAESRSPSFSEENLATEPDSQRDSFETDYTRPFAAAPAGFAIDKSGLNFRQMRLSKEERRELERLKQRVFMMMDQMQNNNSR